MSNPKWGTSPHDIDLVQQPNTTAKIKLIGKNLNRPFQYSDTPPASILQHCVPKMPPKILDTHIHLWPSSALTPKNHGWMTDPAHILTKRHGISDYLRVAPDVDGFVYVETDRYLPSALPDININSDKVDEEALRAWCKEPLEEIKFLRRVVEGEADEEIDGVGTGQEERMKGVVLFAPFHLPPPYFNTYLRIARETASPTLWRKVVGFRYLLQGKGEGEVERLVSSEDWISNLLSLSKSAEHGGKAGGWVFEVGADVHRDGTAGLEAIVKMVREVRKQESHQAPVRFVLSTLFPLLFFLARYHWCFLLSHQQTTSANRP
jgi:L-rhamnono-1,4-lactonase